MAAKEMETFWMDVKYNVEKTEYPNNPNKAAVLICEIESLIFPG